MARDVGYLVAHYAADADIRFVGLGHPPTAPLVVRGRRSIAAWLLASAASQHDLKTSHLVDGGDRVAFRQHWQRTAGTFVVLSSTAELQDGLIATQHTILELRRPVARPRHVAAPI